VDDAGPLAEVLEQYNRALTSAGLIDPRDRCWSAASRVSEGHPWIRQFDRVVIHAIYDLNDCEFALIHNLIAALPEGGTAMLFNTTANVRPTQFAEWTWQRFLTDEALADKTFPEFFRPGGPNRELLERLFVWQADEESSLITARASGVRILEARGRYAEVEAIGSEIVDLLARGVSPAEIAVAVRHIDAYGEIIDDVFARYGIPAAFETGVPLIRVPFIKYWIGLLDLVSSDRPRHAMAQALSSAYHAPRLSPAFDVEGALIEIGYIDRKHLSAAALAARRVSPLTAEFAHFEALLDGMETAVKTPREFMEEMGPQVPLSDRDRQAWEILQKEIEYVDGIAGAIPFLQFRKIVSELSGIRTISRFSSRPSVPGVQRVSILTPSALGRRSYPWVFAPGFADDEIPSRVSANPLLPDSIVEPLNRKLRPRRLLTSRDRGRLEPLYLFMLLDAVSEQAILSFPSSTLEGETIYPSIYIGEIARHFERTPIEAVRQRPPRETGEHLRAVADAWRDEMLDDAQAGLLLGADVARRAALERRASARAAVGTGAIDAAHIWNPSELNALALCPFIYLSRYRLKLRAPELPDFEIPAMEVGTLAHRILREFYAEPIPAAEEDATARMESIIQRNLAPIDVDGRGPRTAIDPALWRIRRPQLVRALLTWSAFAVRDARDGFETLPEYLDKPLPSNRLADVLVGGRPDHVAIRQTNGELTGIRIDDFKYSAASSFTSKQLDQSFQVPIYAFLAARALNAAPEVAIEGRYLLLRSPSNPIKARAIDEGVFDEAAVKIGALIEKARRGALAPDPSDSQECLSCAYRRLCRLYGD
jgi:ATP-dependent helicase/DNAse subunit B